MFLKDSGTCGVPLIHGEISVTARIYELQGYAIALDKVIFLTRVFAAEDGEGFQFNVRFGSDVRLAPKFATRPEADLQRSLLVKALNER
jgi:hypothetical protein